MSESSAYPEANVIRDVAGWLAVEHITGMISSHLPAHAAALVVTRAAEVGRRDLVDALTSWSRPADKDRLADILSKLKHELSGLKVELRTYAESGPNPTPDAYQAACVALRRAHEANARAGRDAVLAYRDATHRNNPRADGYCMCGQSWDGDGCEEYQSLTLYRPEQDDAAVTAEKDHT